MKYILILYLHILSPFLLISQQKLNYIKAPTSPASSILGTQPSVVLSPKSYQALETALYSNFLNNDRNFVIPNDFALEFTPYWTKNHRLSLEEYLFPKNGLDHLIRNSSFSVASSQNYLLGDSTVSNSVGMGYRTTFYIGNAGDRKKVEMFRNRINLADEIVTSIGVKIPQVIKLIDSNDKFLEEIKPIIVAAVKKEMSIIDEDEAQEFAKLLLKKYSDLPKINDNKNNFSEKFLAMIDEALEVTILLEGFETYLKGRQGLYIDIAYATFLNFPTNNFGFSYIPRQAFWVTPAYRWKDELRFLKAMIVLRYEWYNTGYYKRYFPKTTVYQNNFDYGLAIALDFDVFTLQFESVGRSSNSEIPAGVDSAGNPLYRKESDSDFQYMGSFSYNLSKQMVLTYSLGNRFEPIQNPNNSLVSLVSMNIGFGAPTKDDIDLNK